VWKIGGSPKPVDTTTTSSTVAPSGSWTGGHRTVTGTEDPAINGIPSSRAVS
jgi:hypothetical protein